ncbi:hypothetical protein SADUNF_Sadunf15G0047600 [Salix dunnii]|uniref:Uncharacterized protein n=1 Tax=Salix dunnii TaxID=1413687 RepID=A0A835JF79_9ROSI|nr:hypothetical protein SADUNF_Sadunf15G0047600 [Salix dunnii]
MKPQLTLHALPVHDGWFRDFTHVGTASANRRRFGRGYLSEEFRSRLSSLPLTIGSHLTGFLKAIVEKWML